jgi:hypothetical protein
MRMNALYERVKIPTPIPTPIIKIIIIHLHQESVFAWLLISVRSMHAALVAHERTCGLLLASTLLLLLSLSSSGVFNDLVFMNLFMQAHLMHIGPYRQVLQ